MYIDIFRCQLFSLFKNCLTPKVQIKILLILTIELFHSADGNYEVTLMTKATLKYNGEVFWKPPAIYKSSCEINVEYFPFDEQSCIMKFGSWTYNGAQVITPTFYLND